MPLNYLHFFCRTAITLLLLCPVLKVSAQVWADSCGNNSFLGIIPGAPGFNQFAEVHKYVGDDIIAVGTYSNPEYLAHTYGLVMRVSRSGNIKWARRIGPESILFRRSVSTAAIAANSDIICATEHEVIRFDPDGNTVWKKTMDGAGGSSVGKYISRIIATADNGFLLLHNSPAAIIEKYDQHGGGTWRKRISFEYNVHARGLAEGDDGYYVLGTAGNSSTFTTNFAVVKVNKTDGAFMWIRSLATIGPGQNFEYAFTSVECRDNLVYITGRTHESYTGPRNHAQVIVCLNTAGTLLFSKRIENGISPESLVLEKELYDVSTKTGFYYNLGSGEVLVYRLNDQYVPLWAWKYTMARPYLTADIAVLSDSSFVLCGTGIANVAQEAALIRFSKTGLLENCPGVPVLPLVTDEVLNVQPLVFAPTFLQGGYTEPSDVPISPTNINWQLICRNPTVCRLSEIDGAVQVCTGNPSLYKVTLNGACAGPVSFTSSSPGAQLQRVSDTSFNVVFAAGGRTVIYARLQTSCGELKDSIVVYVGNTMGPVNLGADKTLCPGNPIILRAGPGYSSYLWHDGSTDSLVTITQPGTYYVTAKDACGGIFKDTIVINPQAPFVFTAGQDRSKCNNDTIVLTASPGFSNYLWGPVYNISAVSAQQVVINPAIDTAYFVRAEISPGCFANDTVRVRVFHSPVIDLGNVNSFCEGGSMVLNAGQGYSFYTWNTGHTTSSITITSPGTYWVEGRDVNGCTARDTIIVHTRPVPASFLPGDTSLCIYDKINIFPVDNFESYKWSTGASSRNISVNPGRYWLQATSANGCTGTDTITINAKDCLNGIFFPTAFSPNYDRNNDLFKPVVRGELDAYDFAVYNRWGQLIFHTNDFTKGWDGTIGGKPQSSGNFVWHCRYKLKGAEQRVEKGNVLLVR